MPNGAFFVWDLYVQYGVFSLQHQLSYHNNDISNCVSVVYLKNNEMKSIFNALQNKIFVLSQPLFLVPDL